MQSGQGFSMDAIRKMAEDKVLVAVDGVLGRIPNGQQYREQFRQAINGAMDDLQQQAQGQMGNMGGMMGKLGGALGRKSEGDNPLIH